MLIVQYSIHRQKINAGQSLVSEVLCYEEKLIYMIIPDIVILDQGVIFTVQTLLFFPSPTKESP